MLPSVSLKIREIAHAWNRRLRHGDFSTESDRLVEILIHVLDMNVVGKWMLRMHLLR